MKKAQLFLFSFFFLLVFVIVPPASAETKAVELPKGTMVEKTPEGCLKFTLPGGCVVKVKGFMKNKGQAVVTGECGIIGDCGIFDGTGKFIATGRQGKILNGPKPGSIAPAPGGFLKFEGTVLYLPAVVEFEPVRIFNRQALMKLAPQPALPGTSGR
jgi:hypothetical protein